MKEQKNKNKNVDYYFSFKGKNRVLNNDLINFSKDNFVKLKTIKSHKNINKNLSNQKNKHIKILNTPNNEWNLKIISLLKSINISYDAKDLFLYEVALTHKSYANEYNLPHDNQRLEFLGDSVINFLVTNFLYEYKNLSEGEMTKARISIVQSKTLARAANKLQLNKYLRIGKGLKEKNLSNSIMEDAFEALMGAIYINQQKLENINKILHSTILKWYLVDDLKNTIDYKTKFQEMIQSKNNKVNIQYHQTNNSKPLNFEVELWCDNKKVATGKGRRLKDAETDAAKTAFLKLKSS